MHVTACECNVEEHATWRRCLEHVQDNSMSHQGVRELPTDSF